MIYGFALARDSLQAHEPMQRMSRFRRFGYQRWLIFRNQINLHYFWEKRWFFIAMLVGFIFLQLDTPTGMTREGHIVLAMSVVATILFISEPVPLPTVALLIIIGQVVLLGLESTEVAKSLMTDSVLFIMGSLMLAVAVVKQKLDKRIAWLIVQITGTKTVWICFGISVVSGVLASFVGEHTVAAMMLPVRANADYADVARPQEGAQSGGLPAVFDIVRLLGCRHRHTFRAALVTRS